MDATRARRTRDAARQAWYAFHRQQRFADRFGFASCTRDLSAGPACRRPSAGRGAAARAA